MSSEEKNFYACSNCSKEFKHHSLFKEIVKCPYCGSIRVKIVTKETITKDGAIEIEQETTIHTESIAALGIEIIFLAVGVYVAAFILPGALTAIATTALTSVNAGVVTLFQVLVPLIGVGVTVIALILIRVITEALD